MRIIDLNEGDTFNMGNTNFFVLSLGETYTAVMPVDVVNQVRDTKEAPAALNDVKEWILRTSALTEKDIPECRLMTLRDMEFYKDILDRHKASMTWLITGNAETDYRRVDPYTNEMDMEKKKRMGIRPLMLMRSDLMIFGAYD